MPVLEDFASARIAVSEFLRTQRASIAHFWDDVDLVFFRTEADRASERDKAPRSRDESVHRLTSTVTCLESLLEAPAWDCNPGEAWTNARAEEVLAAFIRHALTTTVGWQSDQAAWVYCRVRTLGSALRIMGDPFSEQSNQVSTAGRGTARLLVEQAWLSRYDAGGSFGLREATTDPAAAGVNLSEATGPKQYPPNAFLTYWGLLASQEAEKAGLFEDDQAARDARTRERNAAMDWLRESLASQVTFHYSKSRFADPQQLAWSICGLLRFGDQSTLANGVSSEHELLVAGLRAFFAQQDAGTWPTGAPLFHYQNAGNAYAYVYETLGELVCLATSRQIARTTADVLADLLREHSQELMDALDHAAATGQRLEEPSGDERPQGSRSEASRIGWSSGHHPHRNSPESWATASVYRFGQGLRRLVGLWSGQAAKEALGARRPTENLKTLRDRGASWDLGSGTAGGFLSTAFVHPVLRQADRAERTATFWLDPDERVLEDNQARSAMLFGPPGTGKTKMIEAVAGAIGWDFIEITPAQFLDRGVDYVSARADVIFRQAMELDHCVVLLDEIDELIQQRTNEAETIERFFTTTMLPRLAKLWDARRILFFVNTNNIERVDSAIVRSQRFDAARIILPPGYASKEAALASEGLTLAVSHADVNQALNEPGKVAPENQAIGWLALVRFDQYGAVIRALKEAAQGSTQVDVDLLRQGVKRIAGELARLDWHDHIDQDFDPAVDVPLPRVRQMANYERRDARAPQWARISTETIDQYRQQRGASLDALAERLKVECRDLYEGERYMWVCLQAPENAEIWAQERAMELQPDGVLRDPEAPASSSPPATIPNEADSAGTPTAPSEPASKQTPSGSSRGTPGDPSNAAGEPDTKAAGSPSPSTGFDAV